MYILVTGASGFIGTNLLYKLKNKKILTVSKDVNSNLFLEFKNKKVSFKEIVSSEIVLVHLATYFSKSDDDKDKITNANIEFGNELINFLSGINIKKIIYTNTMYIYYKDESVRSLHYTKTKSEFSKTLTKYSKENKIAFDELYLDNTFGITDKRLKIVPIILKSIKDGLKNPIINPEININLMHIDPIIQRIILSINDQSSYRNSFISNTSINLGSLYLFLKNCLDENFQNYNSISYSKNEYINNFPKIDYLGIKVESIEDSLRRYVYQWK